VIYNPVHHTGNNVPVSFDFSKNLRVNVNFAVQYIEGTRACCSLRGSPRGPALRTLYLCRT
jgi:hypothetical protein